MIIKARQLRLSKDKYHKLEIMMNNQFVALSDNDL
jgi:hypothetical protein